MKIGNLAKGTVIYGVGTVLTRMLGLLTLPLFTAYLAPAEYGISAMLTLMSTLLASLFTLGLGTSLGLVYFREEAHAHRHRTIWSGFLVLLASAGLLVALGVAGSEALSRVAFHTPEHAHFVVIALVATAFSMLSQPFQLGLQFEQKARDFVALSAMASVVGVAVSVSLVIGLKLGVIGVLIGSACTQALTFVLFSGRFLLGRPFAASRPLAWQLLVLGAPMIPSFFSLFILQQTNRYVLEWFQGLDAVGLYSVGASLGTVMTIAVTAFSNAWTPYFLSFKEKREEAESLFGRVASYYVIGFGFLSLLFYAFAGPLIQILAAPAYHEAYRVIGLTATSHFLIGAYGLVLPPVYFNEEVKFSALMQGLAATLAVGLNLLLIPRLGVIGAAVAHAAGFLLMVGLQHLWNRAQRHRYMAIAYEWRRLALFGIVYVAFASALTFERQWPLLQELALSLGASALLLPVAWFLLTDKERRRALSLVATYHHRLTSRA